MSIDQIRALVVQDFEAVNNLIIDKIQPQVGLIDDLSNHIVQSGGKRLRPLLVLLASKACGYEGNAHIPLAAVVEFIHTATLLHDDVLDESTLRRGRETANSIWGNKASILVGDFLFTQSMQLTLEVGNMEIIRIITDACLKIISGEVKQFVNRFNISLSVEDYFEVIHAKTAQLFGSAARVGTHLIPVDPEIQNNLYDYGLHIGNAFQLIDDALDYCSDAKTLGKNIGDDLVDGKVTLPLIHALKHGTMKQKEQITQSLKESSLTYLPEILSALEETKAIEFTRQMAINEVDKALSALVCLPNSPYKNALEELANFAIQRNY